jgi:hypothetical protein
MTESHKEKTTEELNQEKINNYIRAFQKLQLIDLSTFPYRIKEQLVGTFTRDDLRKYIQAPELEPNQKQLRRISKYLYNVSPQYNMLINYMSSILTLDFMIKPLSQNPKKIKKKEYENKYYQYTNFVERMNIRHEFSRILEVVYRDGVYCGYVHQDKDDFFFQQLDTDFCKITYFERGMYFISFNLVYFFIYPERLAMFPKEFADAYNSIKNDIKSRRSTYWWQLKSENTICIKTDESNWYFLPPYVGSFESALNINDFKQLEKAEAEIGNYKLLFQKIPIDTTEGLENKFLLTEDFVQTFHSNIESGLPPQVGLMTSPMDITDISFEKDSVDRNKVADATSQYWSDTGVSQLLFSSSNKTSAASLVKAIMTDEAKSFKILYQIERWLNIYLGNYFKDKLFKVEMPKITIFNRDEVINRAKEAATYGFPVKRLINAAMGNDPSSMFMDAFLENEILQLPDKFIPMMSSHTTSGNDKGGRPSSTTITDSKEQTIEDDTNNPDARG